MKHKHYLLIGLRNQDTVTPLEVISRSYAMNAIAFVATTFLRKHPMDRSGCWMLGGPVYDTIVGPEGVSSLEKAEYIAAFDPRDITSIIYTSRPDPDLDPLNLNPVNNNDDSDDEI